MTTPLSSVLWMVAASFVGSFGAVFLKIGAGRIQKNLAALMSNWRLAMGVVFYLLSSVFYVRGVRQGELSVLYPMVSLGSVWTLAWSRLFLNEPLTRTKFIAVGMIVTGMVLLWVGSR